MTRIYNAVLMDDDFMVTGHFKMSSNPRYLVVHEIDGEAAMVLGSDEEPREEDIPAGDHVFHRVGSAVWLTEEEEASVIFEYLGVKP